jgi:hypothetical protein
MLMDSKWHKKSAIEIALIFKNHTEKHIYNFILSIFWIAFLSAEIR